MEAIALAIPFFVSAYIYKATQRTLACKCTEKDYQKLLKSAARAKLAYLSPEEVEELYKKPVPTNTFENWMLPQLTSLPTFITSKGGVEDAQAYVWKDQDVLYISYRGTSSIQDALADLKVCTHWLNNSVCVHEGFWRQFKSIEEDVQSHITGDVKMICMGGHSMGAACAQLAAVVFADRFPNVKFVC
ncbi:MAG: lipase family protein, partial [Bacteroidota bacterium]